MSTGSGPGNIFSSVKDFLLFNSQAATIPNIKQSYFLFHTSIGTIHVSAILTSWQSSPHRDCISMVLCDAASLQRLYYRNLKDALLCPWKLINCGEINAAQIPCQPQLQSLQPSGASIRIIIKKYIIVAGILNSSSCSRTNTVRTNPAGCYKPYSSTIFYSAICGGRSALQNLFASTTIGIATHSLDPPPQFQEDHPLCLPANLISGCKPNIP